MVSAVALSRNRTNVSSLGEVEAVSPQREMIGLTEGLVVRESGATTAMIRPEAIEIEVNEKDFFDPTIMSILLKGETEEEVRMKTVGFIPKRISLFLITSSAYLGTGLVIFILSLTGSLHLLTGLIGLVSGLGLFMTSILNYKHWRREVMI